eukprot:5498203-Prymnesium_polylepis.4
MTVTARPAVEARMSQVEWQREAREHDRLQAQLHHCVATCLGPRTRRCRFGRKRQGDRMVVAQKSAAGPRRILLDTAETSARDVK